MISQVDDRVRAVMPSIDRTIADADTMYMGNPDHYFSVGASALRWLLVALEAAGAGAPRRILDFGCGYGRVLRTVRAAFPAAELLACDVDAEGVSFCERTFHARGVAGNVSLDRSEKVRDVDLIWCGSVMTHLDMANGERLLRHFTDALAPSGVAVFTTHGRKAAWRLARETDYGLDAVALAATLDSYRKRGFGYSDYPGQTAYGISLATPACTTGQLSSIPSLRLVGYVEAGWDGHQDVVSVAKDADRVLLGP